MGAFGNYNPEAAMGNEKEAIDEILDKAAADRGEVLAERRAALAAAKSQQAGKEAFDIAKLAELYDLTDDSGRERLSPEKAERLEMEYYLDNPDAKTLAEFAKIREDLDANASG